MDVYRVCANVRLGIPEVRLVLSRKHLFIRLVSLPSLIALSAAGCGASSGEEMHGPGHGTVFAGSGAAGRAAGGGVSGRGVTGPGGFAGGAPPIQDLGRPAILPPAMATANPATACLAATVLFVVDGSGSMCAPFGTATRWTALRQAVLAPMVGVVPRLAGRAEIGLMVYDGSIDFTAAGMATTTSPNPMCGGGFGGLGNMACPRLSQVPPGMNNEAMLDRAFGQTQPGGSTPTDKAMNMAVDQMIAHLMGRDPVSNPHVIILATDGEPNDICTGGLGGDGSAQKAGVIAAVDRAALTAGIRTYVISLAGDDQGLEAHLAEVAKHGDPMNPMAHSFSPMAPDDLQNVLTTVIGAALGCAI